MGRPVLKGTVSRYKAMCYYFRNIWNQSNNVMSGACKRRQYCLCTLWWQVSTEINTKLSKRETNRLFCTAQYPRDVDFASSLTWSRMQRYTSWSGMDKWHDLNITKPQYTERIHGPFPFPGPEKLATSLNITVSIFICYKLIQCLYVEKGCWNSLVDLDIIMQNNIGKNFNIVTVMSSVLTLFGIPECIQNSIMNFMMKLLICAVPN